MSDLAYERKEVILRVADLSLAINGRKVLRDINFEVKDIVRPGCTQGQVLALLGPSGIGKTQLLRMLAGLQRPSTGTVTVTDKAIPVHPGMIGMVTQSYTLFGWRTVLGNLMTAARQAGLPTREAREKSLDLLRQFHLEPCRHLYPAQLSGGQRQRVAIAQQVLSGGHYLLMDEPFSGLDMLEEENVCKLIVGVSCADDLNTIIVVTHDVRAAATVADTILMLGQVRSADGKLLPGATICEKYDLIERNLAWHEQITTRPEFYDLMRELRAKFVSLAGP